LSKIRPEQHRVELAWDEPVTGIVSIGAIEVTVPASADARTWRIVGRGTADLTGPAGPVTGALLNVSGGELRTWGAPSVTGELNINLQRQKFAEGDTRILELAGSNSDQRIGWWINGGTGRATLTVDPADPAKCSMRAKRAGVVDISAVAGGQTVSISVPIKAAIAPATEPAPARWLAQRREADPYLPR
jgi:hypothetical protein